MKDNLRVFLRGLEIEDYISLHKWRQDDEIFNYYRGIAHYPSSINEKNWVESRINDKENVTCAICLKENNQFIGCTFLNSIDLINRSARGGTFIGDKNYIGCGYGYEGRLLILKHAFFDWGMERVWAHIHVSNSPSLKMHAKCGYEREGLLRNASYKNGKFEDIVVMAVLREDFEELIAGYQI
ncbi:MAG: GNAT family protein [Candidatus Cloacimonetes bacterium]|jgi:RimJ/RimL family protein N-acetyltransferase|nr:GNAT family protein [Candidatus Cloacimonadota bacterium]